MKRIIYLSSATKFMSDFELNNLLEMARVNNKTKSITGLLLYIDGDFIQIIEGDDFEVNNLYSNIQFDKRHKNIICVSDEKITKRQFPEWSMGFNATSYKILNRNPTYADLNSEALFKFDDKTALIFIETFLNSHKNFIDY
jgi:hypothetical protein